MIKSILYGVAVGDAIGFPFQFRPRSERKSCLLVGMGKYLDGQSQDHSLSDECIGLWSDDTSLTLCLAESLLKGYDLKDQAESFVAWLDKGYMSALDYAFDQGHQTIKQLTKVRQVLRSGNYKKLEHLANDAGEDSNGNGSLMRILPLVLYIKGMDMEKQFNLVHLASALTHPHIRSALCCFYYLKMAEYILTGEYDKFEAYEQARIDTYKIMQKMQCPESEYNALYRLLYEQMGILEEDEIDSGGYVVSTLEASIWCLLTSNSYSEAVLKAVNLGEDTDTTGAVTGGLAALLYGFDSIPKGWIALLKKPELFTNLIARWEEKP